MGGGAPALSLHARQAGEPGAPAALLLHGWPGSSHTWRHVLPAVADAGWHAIAPDLPGHGDTPLEPYDGTWEDHVRALDAFVAERLPERFALVAHDWGGLIGLRWAVERPERISALVLSNTGFFADGQWHGIADTLRGPAGDRALDNLSRTTFSSLVRAISPAIGAETVEEMWKGVADDERRRAVLALYRSGDLPKLAPYEPLLAELRVPALVLWGALDRFAPVSGAHRFVAQLPDARLVVLEEAGHFLHEDAPERVAQEIAGFLRGVSGASVS